MDVRVTGMHWRTCCLSDLLEFWYYVIVIMCIVLSSNRIVVMFTRIQKFDSFVFLHCYVITWHTYMELISSGSQPSAGTLEHVQVQVQLRLD